MKPMVEGHTREECSGATADDARGTIWDLGCDQWAHMPDRLVGGGVDLWMRTRVRSPEEHKYNEDVADRYQSWA